MSAPKYVKQIIRVLDAVELGCETSDAVSAVTGLPIAHCANYLHQLVQERRIQRVKQHAVRFNKRGWKSHVYYPLAGRVPELDAGPLNSITIDSYVSPDQARAENLKAGFNRPDRLTLNVNRARPA